MKRKPEVSPGVKPTSARVYNYMLDGKDAYGADEKAARAMLAVAPDLKAMARYSRQFLAHSIEVAAQAGVRQFLDLGAGVPTSPSTHEIARATAPDAQVVYVDYDPVVHMHCTALLTGSPGVSALLGDVREPVDILTRCKEQGLIDFAEPVAVLLIGVLHFVMDDENPAGILARLRRWMAPGSVLVFTHDCDTTAAALRHQMITATRSSPAHVTFRSASAIAALLTGFEPVPPGLAPVQQWLDPDLPDTTIVKLAAIGRRT
jgi:hypothetical protein